MKLHGNTVLITGGSSGIGLAMAEAFLDAGSTVLICGRSEKRLNEARARRPEFHVRVCDVSREEGRQALLTWVREKFPALNVFVNNAGVQRDIDLSQGLGEFLAGENEIRINLEAPILLTGMFAPLLAHNRAPALINVSSGLGFVPMAGMPVYCASKAGMHAFCIGMRLQLIKIGIKVFEIIPPAVDTNLNPQGRAKRGGFKPDVTPQEFAAAVMRGLKDDVPEIGYGMTADLMHVSRVELDRRFKQMNNRI